MKKLFTCLLLLNMSVQTAQTENSFKKLKTRQNIQNTLIALSYMIPLSAIIIATNIAILRYHNDTPQSLETALNYCLPDSYFTMICAAQFCFSMAFYPGILFYYENRTAIRRAIRSMTIEELQAYHNTHYCSPLPLSNCDCLDRLRNLNKEFKAIAALTAHEKRRNTAFTMELAHLLQCNSV